jgi:hypothetical protein
VGRSVIQAGLSQQTKTAGPKSPFLRRTMHRGIAAGSLARWIGRFVVTLRIPFLFRARHGPPPSFHVQSEVAEAG